jgi:hypothetical protein
MSLDITLPEYDPSWIVGDPFAAAQEAARTEAAEPANPWAEWGVAPVKDDGIDPGVGGMMWLPGQAPGTDVARQFAESLGLDPTLSSQWYVQGTQNPDYSLFAGAQDTSNWYLQPGWGIANMLKQSGNWDDSIAGELAQWVNQGYEDMNMRRTADKEKSLANLAQFVGMLGGLAFSPLAFGGSEFLGSVGGKLAGAGASALSSAIGGGNPLLSLAGNLAPIGMDLSGASGMLAGVNPVLKSVAENAVGQFASTGDLDPRSLALGAAGAGLDWGWNELGGAEGMFGGDVALEDTAQTIEGLDTEPVGLRMSYDIAPPAAKVDIPEAPFEPLALQMSDLPGLDGMARSFYIGEYAAPSMPAPSAAEEPTLEPAAAPAEAPAEPTQEDINAMADVGNGQLGEEAKSPFSDIKPSTVLKLAVALGGLLGGDAAGDEARAVYEAEYANDEARRQAYLDYSNRILAAIPEIADAYDPDAYREIGQFGTVEIDPETGEARFVPTAEGQKSIDDLINAADNVIDQILETDTSKLSAEEFQKAMTELQGKRDQDFAKLMRVLYARGMLGLATYGEAFDNPFTGRTESYQLEEGQAANPYLAALQSGVERENAELAGLSMNQAEDFIDQLLSQSTDLTGQLGARGGNMLDAILGARGRYGDIVSSGQARGNALAQLLQSPAGMFGGNAASALAAEDYMSEEERKRLLAMLEGE